MTAYLTKETINRASNLVSREYQLSDALKFISEGEKPIMVESIQVLYDYNDNICYLLGNNNYEIGSDVINHDLSLGKSDKEMIRLHIGALNISKSDFVDREIYGEDIDS